jgi:hypothetical protein
LVNLNPSLQFFLLMLRIFFSINFVLEVQWSNLKGRVEKYHAVVEIDGRRIAINVDVELDIAIYIAIWLAIYIHSYI